MATNDHITVTAAEIYPVLRLTETGESYMDDEIFIFLKDTQSNHVIKTEVRRLLEEYLILQKNDAILVDVNKDRKVVPVSAVTWRGERGNLGKDLFDLMLGRKYYFDVCMRILAVCRGFAANMVVINRDGDYIGYGIKTIDELSALGYSNVEQNTKLQKLMSNIRVIVARSLSDELNLEWVQASQARLLALFGYEIGMLYSMSDKGIIYVGNNNLMIGRSDLLKYIQQINLFRMIYDYIVDGAVHSNMTTEMLLRISFFFTGEYIEKPANASFDDVSKFILPNRSLNDDSMYNEDMYRDKAFRRRSYAFSEFLQLCLPTINYDVRVSDKSDYFQSGSHNLLQRRNSVASAKRITFKNKSKGKKN